MIFRVFSLCRLAMPLCALLLCLPLGAQAQSAPVVAVSIKPLQLLAAAITDGVSEPALVLNAAQDPHHASLRPSERRALQQADLVLWTGPLLEVPLDDVVASLVVPVVTAQQLPQVQVLTVDGEPDPHLWLDSRNARAIATALQQALQQLDPAHAERYGANLQQLLVRLDDVDQRIAGALAPLRDTPWAVSHHAFRYFTQQHNLQAPLALADTANNAPGVRSALQLRAQIAEQHIACLLTEPTENHLELESLLDGSGVHIMAADALGLALTPSATAYSDLLLALSDALQNCLGNTHD